MKSSEIVKTIKKSSSSMEKLYNNYEKHNLKYGIVSALIRCGIALDYCIPFLASTIVISSVYDKLNRVPFIKNDIKEYASTYSMMTSNGYSKKIESYENEYTDKSIEYSSGWIINDHNLYERDVIVYRYNDNDVDLEKVLNMSNEEISNLYTVCNYKKIQKQVLDEEDYIYNEDVVILNRVSNSESYRIRKETDMENILSTAIFILFILVGSNFLSNARNLLIRETIGDKLKKVQRNYKPLSKKEWNCAKKILEIRKENVDLISNEKNRGI